jgi:hypothetical protein
MRETHQNLTHQTCIQNQSIEQMDIKFKKLQIECTNQAPKLDQIQNTVLRFSENLDSTQTDVLQEIKSLGKQQIEQAKRFDNMEKLISKCDDTQSEAL